METLIGRQYIEGVCCAHKWVPAGETHRRSACTMCDSKCTRDKDGVIVEYERGNSDAPEEAERSVYEAPFRRMPDVQEISGAAPSKVNGHVKKREVA